jgi:hypothetical protein
MVISPINPCLACFSLAIYFANDDEEAKQMEEWMKKQEICWRLHESKKINLLRFLLSSAQT